MVLSAGFIIFSGVSIMGVMFALLSSGLLGLWICLELSFFGFIPILNGKTVAENEATVKYFIVQVVGSGVLLMGFIFISSELFTVASSGLWYWFPDFVIVFGFMIKLGVFPMHFWFPSVMGSASWFSCFWLSVVQKLGPFWGVSGLGVGGWLLNMVVFLMVTTSVVGAIGGLAQVQFRPLLAYSSLGQTGWLGLIALLRVDIFLVYIIAYSVLLVGLLAGLNLINSYSFASISGWSLSKGLLFWIYSSSFFMSLSGLPPFLGSGLKLMGILTILSFYPILLTVLIMTSMVSLYYYLSMFINGVVSVGSSGFSIYDSLVLNNNMAFAVISLSVMNWFGGFPLFMLTGGLVI